MGDHRLYFNNWGDNLPRSSVPSSDNFFPT
jgi:hypothetical protein